MSNTMQHTLDPRLSRHALDLLTRLRNLGITLYLDEGKLKTKARKNAVTPALATDIKANKTALLDVLSAIQPSGVNAEQVEQQLAFWRDYLNNSPPQHNLPGPDLPGLILSEQGTFARYVFDCDVLDADFPDFDREMNAERDENGESGENAEHPEQSQVFAAFVAWLSLFTRSSDVMVAHDIDDVWRGDMAFDHEFFRPTVPLRFNNVLRFHAPFHETDGLNPNKSQEAEQNVSQWLQHYQQSIEQGRENGVVAYDCLAQLLQKEQSPRALCQIALMPINASDLDEANQTLRGLTHEQWQQHWQARGFELVVGYLPPQRYDRDATPKLLWWADSSRFSSQQIHGFSESFTEFLQAFVAPENANKPVAALPLISKRDKARVLASCKAQQATNAPASLQDPSSLVSAFEAQVAAHPDRIALKFANAVDKEQREQDSQSLTQSELRYSELTYSQLNAKANQLAHALLQALPFKNNSEEPASQLVGLCVSRSLESVIGILGILKAGLGYLPLDPDYPASRLQHMVQDSGISLVVRDSSADANVNSSADTNVNSSVFDSITSLDINQVNAGESHSHSANSNTHNPNLPIQPSDLAYVIYTSGSTGKPKGVAVEHGNVLRLFSTASAHFQFTEQDVWSIFHSFSFDFSVWEMWGALLHGGCGVIVPRIVAQDPAAFYRLATESGVTVLNQTPSAFESFSLVDEAQTGKNSCLSNALRYVIFGGEALKLASLQGWVNRHGDAQPELVNMYGITETTVHVTYKRLLREDIFAGKSARSKSAHSKSTGAGSLIGAPLGDLSAYVLDSRGALLPPGAVGELYVGGAGVSRGYWNRPELTVQKFVSLALDDSFYGGSSYTSTLYENESHDSTTQRLYKTGDLARLQLVEEAGNTRCELIYMGRIDQQVQLRGFRIELGEIDHLLLQQADISQALTVMLSSSDTDREQETQRDSNTYIVSYVVQAQAQIQQKESHTNPENASLSSRLREALAAQLPDYMVPSAFVRLDALPMTAHGKIDRARLPAPDFSAGASDYQAPETEQEQAIAKVWQQVLNVPRVGLNDDFFALGGDSMKALTLVAQCRSAGLAVGIQDLYAAPQLSKLLLRDNASAANRAEIAPFALVSEHDKTALLEKFGGDAMANAIADIYPMTELQQGMLARNLLAQDLGIYHDILGYHLHTSWHAEHFAQALQQVIARNEVLRTLFCLDSEFAHQIVLQQYQGDIHIQDLRHLSAQEQEDAIQSWITEEKVQAFDFAKPTWNIHIHIRSDEAFQYSLNFNHALLDGWSVANLNAQLFSHYMDLQEANVPEQEKTPEQAATPALPYRYHVHFEREALTDANLQTYWQDLLADAQLPWWTGPLKQGVSREVLEIKGSDAQKLVQLAKRYKVSEKTVLQATYLVLMSLLSGKKDVVTSVVVNSRSDEAGSDQTLGLFLNSLPFRLDLTHLTWPALIRQCEQTAQRIQASKHYPLTAIQRDMGLDFSASIFNYVELHLYNELQQRIRVSSGKVFDDKDYLLSFEIFKYIEAQSDDQNTHTDNQNKSKYSHRQSKYSHRQSKQPGIRAAFRRGSRDFPAGISPAYRHLLSRHFSQFSERIACNSEQSGFYSPGRISPASGVEPHSNGAAQRARHSPIGGTAGIAHAQ